MSIANWSALRPTPERLALFLGLLLVAGQPFGGVALPVLLLFILGIWMLWKRRIAFADEAVKRVTIVFLLLFVPVLISIPFSYDPPGSINVALALVLYNIAALVLLQGLAGTEDRAWLSRWMLFVILFWVADAGVQFVFGRDLFGISITEDGRILGPFSGNLHLGLFVTVLAPLVLWRMAGERPWLALAIMASFGAIAGLSGARSNMLFFFLSCALLLTQFAWRHRLAVVAAMIAVFVASTLASPMFASRVDKSVAAITDKQADIFYRLDRILSGRMTIWETALRMTVERPFTGVGANAFAHAYNDYSTRPRDPFTSPTNKPYHAHQMYVAAAAETGLTGLFGLLAIVGFCVVWYLRAPPERRREAAPFAAPLAVIAFPAQSQPVLFTMWWFPVVLLLLCGMIAALSERDGRSGSAATPA